MMQHSLALLQLIFVPPAQANDASTARPNPYQDTYTQGHYPDRIYEGAKWLKTSPDFVFRCWKVVEGLVQRDHQATHQAIAYVRQRYPNSGVDHVGQALLWQSLMLENFDFRYEKQYQTHLQLSRQQLEEAMLIKGNEIWEHFILGSLFAIDTLHRVRQGEWLSSIHTGMQGLKHLNQAKSLSPDFADLKLGDGAWYYGRSLLPKKYRRWGQITDQKQAGICSWAGPCSVHTTALLSEDISIRRMLRKAVPCKSMCSLRPVRKKMDLVLLPLPFRKAKKMPL